MEKKNAYMQKEDVYLTGIDKHIGKRLLVFRQIGGFSQKALARTVGITFQQIQKYEKAKNRIPASRLYQFSKALKVNLNDFFDGYESQAKHSICKIPETSPPDFSRAIAMFSEISDPNDRAGAAKAMVAIVKIFKKKKVV